MTCGEPANPPGLLRHLAPLCPEGPSRPQPSSFLSALRKLEELGRETRSRASVFLTREAVVRLRERTLAERESLLQDRFPSPPPRDSPQQTSVPRTVCPEARAQVASVRRELTALTDAYERERLRTLGLEGHCSMVRETIRRWRGDQRVADKSLLKSRQQIVDANAGLAAAREQLSASEERQEQCNSLLQRMAESLSQSLIDSSASPLLPVLVSQATPVHALMERIARVSGELAANLQSWGSQPDHSSMAYSREAAQFCCRGFIGWIRAFNWVSWSARDFFNRGDTAVDRASPDRRNANTSSAFVEARWSGGSESLRR